MSFAHPLNKHFLSFVCLCFYHLLKHPWKIVASTLFCLYSFCQSHVTGVWSCQISSHFFHLNLTEYLLSNINKTLRVWVMSSMFIFIFSHFLEEIFLIFKILHSIVVLLFFPLSFIKVNEDEDDDDDDNDANNGREMKMPRRCWCCSVVPIASSFVPFVIALLFVRVVSILKSRNVQFVDNDFSCFNTLGCFVDWDQ